MIICSLTEFLMNRNNPRKCIDSDQQCSKQSLKCSLCPSHVSSLSYAFSELPLSLFHGSDSIRGCVIVSCSCTELLPGQFCNVFTAVSSLTSPQGHYHTCTHTYWSENLRGIYLCQIRWSTDDSADFWISLKKSVCGVAKAASDTAEDEAKQNYCFQCSCVFVVPRVCVCVSFPSSCMFSVSFLCLCHFHMIFIDYSIKDNTAVIYSYCIYFDIQTDVAWLDAVCILFIQSDIVLHLSRNRNVFT